MDPTGHFSEEAIWDYAYNQCGSIHCADDMVDQWSQDTEWWAMLRNAVAGDILFGAYGLYSSYGEGNFSFMFTGEGDSLLTGIVSTDIYGNSVDTPLPGTVSLKTIQQGEYTIENPLFLTGEQIIRVRWGGILRTLDNGDPFIFARQVNWDNTFIYTEGMQKRNNFIWSTTVAVGVGLPLMEVAAPLALTVSAITGSAISAYGGDFLTNSGGMAGDIYIDTTTNQFVIRPGVNNKIIDFK